MALIPARAARAALPAKSALTGHSPSRPLNPSVYSPSQNVDQQTCQEFFMESSEAKMWVLRNVLEAQPWIRTCVDFDPKRARSINEYVNNQILSLQGEEFTQTQFLQIAKEYQKRSGVDLFSLGVVDRNSEYEIITYPPIVSLLNGLLYDYQFYGLLALEKVKVINSDGSLGPAFQIDPAIISRAKDKKREILSILNNIRTANPEFFFCEVARSYIYSNIDLRSDYDANLTSQSSTEFMDYLSLQKQQLMGKAFAFYGALQDAEASGLDDLDSKRDDLSDFAEVYNLFKQDGLLANEQSFTCKADPTESELAGGKPLAPSVCLQKGLSEVIAMDPLPLNNGQHFNGAGSGKCQFILASWKSSNNKIPRLWGRFVNELGQQIVLECRSPKIQGSSIESPPEFCVELSSPPRKL